MLTPSPTLPFPIPIAGDTQSAPQKNTTSEGPGFAQVLAQTCTQLTPDDHNPTQPQSQTFVSTPTTPETPPAPDAIVAAEPSETAVVEVATSPMVLSLVAAITFPTLTLPVTTVAPTAPPPATSPSGNGQNVTTLVTIPPATLETGQVPKSANTATSLLTVTSPTPVTQASGLTLTATQTAVSTATPRPETLSPQTSPLALPGAPVDSHAKPTFFASGAGIASATAPKPPQIAVALPVPRESQLALPTVSVLATAPNATITPVVLGQTPKNDAPSTSANTSVKALVETLPANTPPVTEPVGTVTTANLESLNRWFTVGKPTIAQPSTSKPSEVLLENTATLLLNGASPSPSQETGKLVPDQTKQTGQTAVALLPVPPKNGEFTSPIPAMGHTVPQPGSIETATLGVAPLAQNAAPSVQNVAVPTQNSASPADNVAIPVENSVPPVQNVTPSIQSTVLPAQKGVLPVENAAPSVQNVAVPTQNSASPADNVAIPVENSVPSGQIVPPQKATPPAQNVPFAVQNSAPSVQTVALPAQSSAPSVQNVAPFAQSVVLPASQAGVPTTRTIEAQNFPFGAKSTVPTLGFAEAVTPVATPNAANDTGAQSQEEQNPEDTPEFAATPERTETPARASGENANSPLLHRTESVAGSSGVSHSSPSSGMGERLSVVEQVSRHLETMRMANGRGEISLQLNPESLGSVRVTISTKPEGVVAVILTETSQAQQAMEGAKDQLRSALEMRGLRLSTLDVNVGQQAMNGGHFGFAGRSDTPQERAAHSLRTRSASGFDTKGPVASIAAVAEVTSIRSRSRLDYRA